MCENNHSLLIEEIISRQRKCHQCSKITTLMPSNLCALCDIISKKEECKKCGELEIVLDSGYCIFCNNTGGYIKTYSHFDNEICKNCEQFGVINELRHCEICGVKNRQR